MLLLIVRILVLMIGAMGFGMAVGLNILTEQGTDVQAWIPFDDTILLYLMAAIFISSGVIEITLSIWSGIAKKVYESQTSKKKKEDDGFSFSPVVTLINIVQFLISLVAMLYLAQFALYNFSTTTLNGEYVQIDETNDGRRVFVAADKYKGNGEIEPVSLDDVRARHELAIDDENTQDPTTYTEIEESPKDRNLRESRTASVLLMSIFSSMILNFGEFLLTRPQTSLV